MIKNLFEQLQEIYHHHDNAALLVVLETTAKQLRAKHDADSTLTVQQRAQELATLRLPVYYSARMAPDLKVFTEDDVAKVRLRQTDINSMQKP